MRLLPINWRRKSLAKLTPVLVAILHWLGRSVRIRAEGFERYQEAPGPFIFCTWHGRLFLAAQVLQGRGLTAMISKSRDGDLISSLFERWGFEPIRGSTGRDGVRALIGAISTLKAGRSMAITPDGPRGPARQVQDGVLAMAHKSGALIVPVSTRAKRCLFVKSWDQFMVPLPFSTAVMIFGEPIAVGNDLEAARKEVARALDQIQTRTDEAMR